MKIAAFQPINKEDYSNVTYEIYCEEHFKEEKRKEELDLIDFDEVLNDKIYLCCKCSRILSHMR